jgi:hypothetical protein
MLPKPIALHPAAAEYTLASDPLYSWANELVASPHTRKRLGSTVWYAPGGSRQIVLLRENGELIVKEFWSAGEAYEREHYRGRDIYAAVQAAKDAFDNVSAEGYKSHSQCFLGIQECFGFDTRWDRSGEIFDAERLLDSLRRAARYRDHEDAADYDRRQYAEENGLLDEDSTVAAPGTRARPSALAERTV